MKTSIDEKIAFFALLIFFALGLIVCVNGFSSDGGIATDTNAVKEVMNDFPLLHADAGNMILTNTVNTQEETDDKNDDTLSPDSLYAAAAVLMDGESGRVLYSKNGGKRLSMASTTKIMTTILALEYGDLEDYVQVSPYAATMPKVKLGIMAGERYRLRDLLLALMLESDNDAAVAIAEHIAWVVRGEQTIEDFSKRGINQSKAETLKFAKLMNHKAADIGATDTYFITPNGLDATITQTLTDKSTVELSHSATAADMARILKYCVFDSDKKEDFIAITSRKEHHFSDYENKRRFNVTNHNAFLTMMDGVISGKTGFTNKAGYCYVGALERGGKKFIVALLACGWPNHKTYKWTDTRALMNYGLNHYDYVSFEIGERLKGEVYEKVDLGNVLVSEGNLGHELTAVPLSLYLPPMTEQKITVLKGRDEEIKTTLLKMDSCNAPVHTGDILGELTYEFAGGEILNYPLYATKDVEAVDFKQYIEWILNKLVL